jgi:hypothetical protein
MCVEAYSGKSNYIRKVRREWALRHWKCECVLHALAHINWNNTFRRCGCVTSLRRQGLRMIKPRLRHIHDQGAAGAGVCSAVSAGHPADNLERKRPRQNLRCRERGAQKTQPEKRAFKRKKKRLFCSAQHLMLVMKTINKKQRGSSLSLNLWWCAAHRHFSIWYATEKLGAPRLFIYLCIHCTMSPHSSPRQSLWLLVCPILCFAVHAQDYIRPRAHNKAFTLDQAWKTFCRLKNLHLG